MALVKYLTESSLIPAQTLPTSSINDALKLDNKELLLVSLLEKLCHTLDPDDSLFTDICQYLYKIGLLEDKKLFTNRRKHVREMYSNYLLQLIGQCKQISYEPITTTNLNIDKLVINHSFYAMNFIELEPLGSGGFGHVYKAYNKIDAKKYAIKIVPFMNINDPNNIRAFNEVRCLSDLTHENVARYYSSWLELSDKIRTPVIENDDNMSQSNSHSSIISEIETASIYPVLYIQMELCVTTLREYLVKRNYMRKDSPLDQLIDADQKIIKGILNGMSYIHDNQILHHDLNPNNIFLDANMRPKIGDFGMSVKAQDQLPQSSSNYGVELYMAPEYLKCGQYTTKSDVYSVGIILFEILSDFKTDMERYTIIHKFRDFQYTITVEPYSVVISQMIQKDPDNRPEFKEIMI
jgi:translation initiation factor 2-alpha kinase 4